jgi:hypothetical protein
LAGAKKDGADALDRVDPDIIDNPKWFEFAGFLGVLTRLAAA